MTEMFRTDQLYEEGLRSFELSRGLLAQIAIFIFESGHGCSFPVFVSALGALTESKSVP